MLKTETYTKLCQYLAFGFGAGYSPKMPGTVGTLVGILFFIPLSFLDLWTYIFICLILFFVGIYLCGKTATLLNVHDHPGIVWDEIVGYLFSMINAPLSWEWVLAGFILFRFFDIIKPWPIRWIDQKVSGGLGIMLDDLLAAAYTFIILQFIAWTFFNYN